MVTIQGKMRVTHQFRNVMRIFIFFLTHQRSQYTHARARTHTHTHTFISCFHRLQITVSSSEGGDQITSIWKYKTWSKTNEEHENIEYYMTMKFIIYKGHLVLWQWNSGKYNGQTIQLGWRRQRIHIVFGRKPSWKHTKTWRWNPSGMLQRLYLDCLTLKMKALDSFKILTTWSDILEDLNLHQQHWKNLKSSIHKHHQNDSMKMQHILLWNMFSLHKVFHPPTYLTIVTSL